MVASQKRQQCASEWDLELTRSNSQHCCTLASSGQHARQRPINASESIQFSPSGIDIYVDLEIDASLPNEDTFKLGTSEHGDFGCDPLIVQEDADGSYGQPGNGEKFGTFQREDAQLIVIDNSLQQNSFQESNSQANVQISLGLVTSVDRDEVSTDRPWPDWGEPLPPEESDVDDTELISNCVTCPDVVTVFEATNFPQGKETRSSSSVSPEDELGSHCTDRDVLRSDCGRSRYPSAENENSADMSAACQLLEMSKFPKSEYSCRSECNSATKYSDSSLSKFNDASSYLEELSGLVEKIYAALPQLSILTSYSAATNEKFSAAGTWTVSVSKDCRRLRMKRIKPEWGPSLGCLTVYDMDNEREVLDRPPWKRQYKSLRTML